MLYFIKDNQIHRYPPSQRCSAIHGNEAIRDTVPYAVPKCDYCMNWWPDDEKKPKLPPRQIA